MSRWTFYDPAEDETYTFVINPDSMSSPHRERALTTIQAIQPGTQEELYASFERSSSPTEWEFGGVIRSEQQHNDLESWCARSGVIHITDHLGVTRECLISAFLPTDRRSTYQTPWRMRYTIRAIVLRVHLPDDEEEEEE